MEQLRFTKVIEIHKWCEVSFFFFAKWIQRTSCHNPIFTSQIFSDVGIQNEATWTEPTQPERDQPYLKTLEMQPEAHFLRFGEVWPSFTRVDQVLPRFDQALTRPKVRFGRPPPNHWVEHIESFDSVLYGSKTDEKWGSYGQNRKKWSHT